MAGNLESFTDALMKANHMPHGKGVAKPLAATKALKGKKMKPLTAKKKAKSRP